LVIRFTGCESGGPRAADHIYVLHDGRLVAHGRHDELIAAASLYAEVFTL
jgi:ATP-binding cassette, subfamily B, bacterial